MSSMETDTATGRIRERVKAGATAIQDQLHASSSVIAREAAETGRTVGHEVASAVDAKLDQTKEGLASGLANTASKLEDFAKDHTAKKTCAMASQGADRLNRASEYLRNRSVHDIGADVRQGISAHPMSWMCAALAAGFLFGVCSKSSRRTAAEVIE